MEINRLNLGLVVHIYRKAIEACGYVKNWYFSLIIYVSTTEKNIKLMQNY